MSRQEARARLSPYIVRPPVARTLKSNTSRGKFYVMATNCFLNYFDATETAIYFEEAGIDLNQDSFHISSLPAGQHLIRSKNNKFLILHDKQFQEQDLTIEQQRCSESKFAIKMYHKGQEGRRGRAVMLYVNKDGKKMMVCCNEKHEIQPVEMELPNNIEENSHKAVFYLTELSTTEYLFESSCFPSEYLGLEPALSNLSKLVLHPKEEQEVVEVCQFYFS
uniref:uncharacterized protein LOC124058837 n=1 Tax=Scatophagus argus TaxID=75038 RepID=UPI001ED8486B|nr:uncharacterized protein LOC124058837 [Scatophagus argus]